MIKITCGSCKGKLQVSSDYKQPFIKCPDCGSMQRIDGGQQSKKEKAIDLKVGQRPSNIGKEEQKIPPEAERLAPPVLSDKKIEQEPQKITHSKITILDDRQLILDAVGERDLQVVFKMVSTYILEANPNKRRRKRNAVIQSLMRLRFSSAIAEKSVEYAEKDLEPLKIIWDYYLLRLKIGLLLFALTAILGFIFTIIFNKDYVTLILQIPVAIGFFYSLLYALSLLSVKIDFLRITTLRYLILIAALLSIFAHFLIELKVF